MTDLTQQPAAPVLTDRCPACLGLPMVTPDVTHPSGRWVIGEYRCPGCGHEWSAYWHADVLDGAA